MLEIVIRQGKTKKKLNCLVDTGRQRSYLSSSAMRTLNDRPVQTAERKFVIKTFWGSAQKVLSEVLLDAKLLNGKKSIPFLVDEKLDLDFYVVGLNAVVNIIQASGFKLAVDFSGVHDHSFSVQGLLGVDLLKVLGPMQLTSLMNGSAFRFLQGLVPFGNVADFLAPETVTQENRL